MRVAVATHGRRVQHKSPDRADSPTADSIAPQTRNRPLSSSSSKSGRAKPASPSNEAPPVGAKLSDRYLLNRIIGRGGTAVVYQAEDLLLEQRVSLKVLLLADMQAATNATSTLADFRAEAIAAMRLSHPNIVRTFNYERTDDWEYLVMEFVEGEDSLRRRQRRPQGRFDPGDVARIGIESLEGLGYAHEQGVIHHDVKPSNILLANDGQVKICDFGLARIAAMASKIQNEQSTVFAGTPAYASPERIAGKPGDHRSDLYSLGASLYMLGEGKTLYGNDQNAAWRGHLQGTPPNASSIPKPIYDVLLRSLEKAPVRRYQSAEDMAHALHRALVEVEGSDVHTRKTVENSWSPKPSRKFVTALPDGDPERNESPPPSSESDLDIDIDIDGEAPSSDVQQGHEPVPVASFSDMVHVPAMQFESRYDSAVLDVPSFYLDLTPVTNACYYRFVVETGGAPPIHWRDSKPPADKWTHPVVCVTFEQAARYAAWCGKRLPTDAEWEAAARRPLNRKFPWGDSWEASRCNAPERDLRSTSPVHQHAGGMSFDGCLDLVGNTWEWTAPQDNSRGAGPQRAWIFGGSFRQPCQKDGSIVRQPALVLHRSMELGFRCACDLTGDDSIGGETP